MQWTSASCDPYYSKGDNWQMTFPNADAAVQFAKSYGFGYTISYPKFKYLQKKNYGDNFKWKGEPKDEPEYD